MAINFPDTPTNGQTYNDPGTGQTWTYELATNSWTATSLAATGGTTYKGSVDITAAPPTGAKAGEQWSVGTGGTANAGFGPGVTGTITKGSMVMYTGTGWLETSHSVPDATVAAKGIVQLADATAITAGGVGRVVDAAQLKTAQAAASGSATAPTAPTTGQVWVDSSVTPAVIKVWSGTAWIPQVGATVTSATAPAAPTAGQMWVDTSATPNVTKIWDGTKWVTATPDGAATAALANDAKYATKAELATENTWDRTGTVLSPANAGDAVDIDFPAGTAALPGLTPVGDPNTGIYSPGADQVAVATNGTGRVFVDADGRVGVGNTAMSSFDPWSNTLVVGTGSGGHGITIYADSNSASIVNFANGTSGGAAIAGSVQYDHKTNTLHFSTDSSKRVHIDSAGKLLLGHRKAVTGSAAKLQCDATINLVNLSSYADNTAARGAGLVAGDVYRKPDGTLMVTY
jgi:hypothetical protein